MALEANGWSINAHSEAKKFAFSKMSKTSDPLPSKILEFLSIQIVRRSEITIPPTKTFSILLEPNPNQNVNPTIF